MPLKVDLKFRFAVI
uniref:Uncharacterized protein n=1 Tax=Anguilla anguilla TaxID=7936 RepID=A0A0E9P5D4_ANGAN